MMKKHISTIFMMVMLIAGLCIFLYPSVSNYINSKHQTRAIDSYNEALANLSKADYESYWTAAKEYNSKVAELGGNLELEGDQMTEYNNVLDPTGTGVMGHLEIPNISVDLPIYHGVEESVLSVGIGHLPGSSLPIGGESTHTVLSGHRGLPSSKLLSDLDQMVVGDTFLIHVLDQTLAYQVDQINIVLPDETQLLGVYNNEDYCTLVTCTPYGVNTHRLLVRGKRVEYNAESRLIIAADAIKYSPIVVAPFIGGPMLLMIAAAFIAGTSNRARRK